MDSTGTRSVTGGDRITIRPSTIPIAGSTSSVTSCPIKAAVETAAAIASATTSPDVVLPPDPMQQQHSAAFSTGATNSATVEPLTSKTSKVLVAVAPKPDKSVSAMTTSTSSSVPTAAVMAPNLLALAPPPPSFPVLTTFLNTQTVRPQCRVPGGMHLPAGVQAVPNPGAIATAHGAPLAQQVMPAQHLMPQCLSYAQLVKRRAGKWTAEEEEYAAILIELFDKGQVLHEKNGVTLRSFLSRKLFCAPMRISKKFAGKGIGKKVFSSRLNSPFCDADNPPPASFFSNLARLREAEMKFLRVAFPDLPGLINPGFAVPIVTGVPFPVFVHGAAFNTAAAAALPTPFLQQGFASQNVSRPSTFGTTPASTVRNDVQSSALQHPSLFHTGGIDSATAATTTSTALDSLQPTENTSKVTQNHDFRTGQANKTNSVPTVQFPAAQPCYSANDTPVTTLVNAEDPEGLCCSTIGHLKGTSGVASYSTFAKTTRVIQEHYVNDILETATAIADPHCSKATQDRHRSYSIDSIGTIEDRSLPATANRNVQSVNATGLPDLLAGFDKIASSKGIQYRNPDTAPAQFSPTYTTDSFDDLHKHLGKGLTPLAQSLRSREQVSSNFAEPIASSLHIPSINAMSAKIVDKQMPKSKLQMRPLECDGTWISLKQRGNENVTTNATAPLAPSDLSRHQSTADSYGIFGVTSANAIHQNAGHFHGCFSDGLNITEVEGHVHRPANGTLNTNLYSKTSIEYSAAAPVSDPSEFGSEDPHSGTESGFADSDETQSEASFHHIKKKQRISQDDDDVHSWYKTLVQD